MIAGPLGELPDAAILCATMPCSPRPPLVHNAEQQGNYMGSVLPQFPFLLWTGEPGLPVPCFCWPSPLSLGP